MVCLSVIELWIKLISEKKYLILHTASPTRSTMPGPASNSCTQCSECPGLPGKPCGEHKSSSFSLCSLCNKEVPNLVEAKVREGSNLAKAFSNRFKRLNYDTYIKVGSKFYTVHDLINEGAEIEESETCPYKGLFEECEGECHSGFTQCKNCRIATMKILLEVISGDFPENVKIVALEFFGMKILLSYTYACIWFDDHPSVSVSFKEFICDVRDNNFLKYTDTEKIYTEITEEEFIGKCIDEEISFSHEGDIFVDEDFQRELCTKVPPVEISKKKCEICGIRNTVKLPKFLSLDFKGDSCAVCKQIELNTALHALCLHEFNM